LLLMSLICRRPRFFCIAYELPSRASLPLLNRQCHFPLRQKFCSDTSTTTTSGTSPAITPIPRATTPPSLERIVDMDRYPIHDLKFAIECRRKMNSSKEGGGLCYLPEFLTPEGIRLLQAEANSVNRYLMLHSRIDTSSMERLQLQALTPLFVVDDVALHVNRYNVRPSTVMKAITFIWRGKIRSSRPAM